MKSSDSYGLFDRLLHRLALGNSALAELSFDLDQKFVRADVVKDDPLEGSHVFVTGLARAGTTILLRHLHDTGCFRSLTYRDMPFPLAPNLWKRFSSPWQRKRAAEMRAHGDGIAINADSPEALEELFWRLHCGADYIHADGLSPHRPPAETMGLFGRYISAITASAQAGETRYLSKNNNNILRLPSLIAAFAQSWFLVPFREPASHALSLWKQHRRFCQMQTADPFIHFYMTGLAHHEFGLGQRPFLFGRPPSDNLSPDMPDYWLELWINVHASLIGLVGPRCRFVSHSRLCAAPYSWQLLAKKLQLPQTGTSSFSSRERKEMPIFDRQLETRANEIHDRLVQISEP